MKSLADVLGEAERAGWGDTIKNAFDLEAGQTFTSSGIFIVDYLAMGGIMEGQQIQLLGHEAGGKTLLATQAMIQRQDAYPDKKVVLIDKEKTFDIAWARLQGLDTSPERFQPLRPNTGEQAIDYLDSLLGAQDVSMVVVDSIPSLIPQTMLDKGADEHVIALISKLVGDGSAKAVTRLTQAGNETPPRQPTVVWVNQFRTQITRFGGSQHAAGGKAIRFWLGQNFEVARVRGDKAPAKTKDDVTGMEITVANAHSVEIQKSKAGGDGAVGMFKLIRHPQGHRFGPGYIDQFDTVWTLARKYELIGGGGAAFSCPMFNIKGKKEELKEWFEDRPGCYGYLQRYIIGLYRERNGKSRTGWVGGKTAPLEEPAFDLETGEQISQGEAV